MGRTSLPSFVICEHATWSLFFRSSTRQIFRPRVMGNMANKDNRKNAERKMLAARRWALQILFSVLSSVFSMLPTQSKHYSMSLQSRNSCLPPKNTSADLYSPLFRALLGHQEPLALSCVNLFNAYGGQEPQKRRRFLLHRAEKYRHLFFV